MNNPFASLTTEEFISLYDACALSEQMWRERSRSIKAGEPRWFLDGEPMFTEEECRSEMKRYRELQKRVSWFTLTPEEREGVTV